MANVIIITGSAGLVGSEAAIYFASLGMHVVGVDNDMRSRFFGPEASTRWNRQRLERTLGKQYTHEELDIRDSDGIDHIFQRYRSSIALIIHAAAQPSHDWAARDPITDFSVNANGTINLLESTRRWCPQAVFIYMSTNKVYGDTPNRLPLVELPRRWEIKSGHEYEQGISETMSIDQCLHSLFGVSKLSADTAVQEYGRYFGLNTVCFRGGCLTGPTHSGTELHGFLAYLMQATVSGKPYVVYGYQGKQVRDNIHSEDLVRAFHEVLNAPRRGEVYNIGGGRDSNCSMLEAIDLAQKIADRELRWSYREQNRTGDHIWWITSNAKFKSHYPNWRVNKQPTEILQEIHDLNQERWAAPVRMCVPV